MPNSFTGIVSPCLLPSWLIFASGALGAGLAILSRFPIVSTSVHPYALNGAPMDVAAGDWFVGKAAASVVILHPLLGQVQIFNTHVGFPSLPRMNSHAYGVQ
jgi:sphingomyelin phosphodiesterase 2